MMVEAHHHIAIHLDEAPVAVIGKAGIAGVPGNGFNRIVVQTKVENCIHHAGHGTAGT